MQLACNSRFLSQVTVAALVAATALTAQELPAKKPAPIGPKAQLHRKTAKPKLTPPQKLGLRLLNFAQSEAAGLQPDMRAFVLWQASHGYTKIDPAKTDYSELHAALKRYPQGLESMNALPNQSSGRRGPGIRSIGTVDTTQAAAEEMLREVSRRQSRILSEAEKDPKQALSDAMGLPLSLESGFSPRASTLSSLARIVASKNPDLSKAALGEIRKIADNMPARNQAQMLADLPEIYLRLGDEDETRNGLNELVKIAGKLYSHDRDVNDPNQAFKAMWPSANLWRHCVQVAAKLAPSAAEEIIEEVPDADIKAFERITFANALLGADTPPLSIIEKHKNGMSAFIQ